MCVITDFVFQVRNQGLSVDSTNSVLFWIWIFFFGLQPQPANKTFAQPGWKKVLNFWIKLFPTSLQKCVNGQGGL